MLEALPSRSGALTVSINGKLLHSMFDPHREARRFLSSKDFSGTSICVLVEPGLDYLSSVLSEEYPHLRTISLHCADSIRPYTVSGNPSHYPADADTIQSFLSHHIEDHLIANTSLLEWEPSAKAFGDDYRRLSREVYRFFRMRGATITTTGLFGRLWLSRRVRTFLGMLKLARPFAEHRPVVIAASGPSLEGVLPILAKHRSSFAVWALSSATASLAKAGIAPDIIFHTDAGYWAEHHLRKMWLEHPIPHTPHLSAPLLAAPLTAAVPEEAASTFPRLLIASESAVERFLLEDTDIPSLRIPSHGTVAGTALYAALECTSERVFFCGLDLAYRDIQPHAAGHAFSDVLLSATHRFRPLHTIYYSRSPLAAGACETTADEHGSRWIQNEALRTYEQWFAARQHDGRFFRIDPSPVRTPGFNTISSGEFGKYAATLPSIPRDDAARPALREAPDTETRTARLRELFRHIRSETEKLGRTGDPAEAGAELLENSLLHETARECNTPAVLRFLRSPSAEDLLELIDSLRRTTDYLESIVDSSESCTTHQSYGARTHGTE